MQIRVDFDVEKQAVEVQFDPQEFKTWDFVIAVLEMAKEHAKIKRQMTMVAQIRVQEMEAANAQQLQNIVRKPGGFLRGK